MASFFYCVPLRHVVAGVYHPNKDFFFSSAGFNIGYSSPLRASSTFLAASPALKPPLEMHIRCPSASSNLSSCDGHAQGQWCGKETHAVGRSVSVVHSSGSLVWNLDEGKDATHLECLDRGNCRSGSAHTVRGRLMSRLAHSALAGGVAAVPHQRTSGRRSHQTAPRQRSSAREEAGQRGASCRESGNCIVKRCRIIRFTGLLGSELQEKCRGLLAC